MDYFLKLVFSQGFAEPVRSVVDGGTPTTGKWFFTEVTNFRPDFHKFTCEKVILVDDITNKERIAEWHEKQLSIHFQLLKVIFRISNLFQIQAKTCCTEVGFCTVFV